MSKEENALQFSVERIDDKRIINGKVNTYIKLSTPKLF